MTDPIIPPPTPPVPPHTHPCPGRALTIIIVLNAATLLIVLLLLAGRLCHRHHCCGEQGRFGGFNHEGMGRPGFMPGGPGFERGGWRHEGGWERGRPFGPGGPGGREGFGGPGNGGPGEAREEAFGPGRGGPGMENRMAGRLGERLALSDAQKKQLEPIVAQAEDAVRKDVEQTRAATRAKIRAILTPEQQKQFDQMQPPKPMGGTPLPPRE